MPIETFNYIDSLNTANPTATDNVSEGDDHLRGLKTTLKNTFPNVTSAVNITPVAKSANYTAVNGDNIIVTAGSITITLPATPTAGDTVTVKDGTGAAADTNWTVARNGSNIASSATDLTFDKNWAEITMTYVDATVGWSV